MRVQLCATAPRRIHVDNLVQILVLAERGLRTPYRRTADLVGAAAEPEPASPAENGHTANSGGFPDSVGNGGGGGRQAVSNGSNDNGYGGASGAGDSGADTAPGAARDMVAEGQVYYASDGAPINNFLHVSHQLWRVTHAWRGFGMHARRWESSSVAWEVLSTATMEPPGAQCAGAHIAAPIAKPTSYATYPSC